MNKKLKCPDCNNKLKISRIEEDKFICKQCNKVFTFFDIIGEEEQNE